MHTGLEEDYRGSGSKRWVDRIVGYTGCTGRKEEGPDWREWCDTEDDRGRLRRLSSGATHWYGWALGSSLDGDGEEEEVEGANGGGCTVAKGVAAQAAAAAAARDGSGCSSRPAAAVLQALQGAESTAAVAAGRGHDRYRIVVVVAGSWTLVGVEPEEVVVVGNALRELNVYGASCAVYGGRRG